MMKKIEELNKAGQLTDYEAQVMDWLLSTGYYAEKYFSDLEVADVAQGMEIDVKVMRGIIGSLVQKGYLFMDYMDDIDCNFVNCCDKGYQLDDDYEDRWGDYIFM